MPNDPRFISKFNEVQFSLDNSLTPFGGLSAGPNAWLGELTPDEGEPLAGSILVGPFYGGSLSSNKIWESLSFKGEGRVGALVWVDNRLVAEGMLTLGHNLRKTHRLRLPRGKRKGVSITALLIVHGRLLEVRSWWTPDGGEKE